MKVTIELSINDAKYVKSLADQKQITTDEAFQLIFDSIIDYNIDNYLDTIENLFNEEGLDLPE